MPRPKRVTRRPSYREAVIWIAENDEPASDDVAEMENLISVVLVAHLFGTPAHDVARDVIRYRRQTSN